MYTQAIVLSTATCYTIDMNKNLYFSLLRSLVIQIGRAMAHSSIDGPRDMA